jgi:filamentous hemagglutinin family protein
VNFRRHLAKPLALAIAVSHAMQAFANPVNPTVVHGTASFAANGSALTVTNSANAIINWQAFSVGKGELTRFVQPSAASAVLNRITGQDPSQILGQLQSNGRVLLLNPNGILFGKDARVDVAGLIASTLNISNDDFLAGRYRFTGDGINGVVNQGAISTPMGGSVYLVGGSVRNEGLITSAKGEVILAAGQTVDLVDTATPNVKVEIIAPAGEAVNLGSIFAGGGGIDIHAATVNQQGIVNADALARDDQGRIRVIASGTMTLGAGSVTSAANNAGGDGGFVETSGAHVQIGDGAKVSTLAPQGKAGTWLIDPVDFTIAASGGDMTGATLSANLGAGNVTILSSSGAVGVNGDIFVNDAVSWSANTLTLTAARNINLNAVMTASGTSILSLDHEFFAGVLKVGINPDGSFRGRVDFPGRSGAGMLTIGAFPYTVINSVGSAGSITAADLQGMNGNRSGFYALGSNINAAVTSTWNGGLGFDPVGTGPTSLFQTFIGRFDGLGHTITGLTINRPTQDYIGLFGLGNGARIRNVGMTGGSVVGRDFVGGLVGFTNSGGSDKIANSYFTGTVTGFSTGNGSVGGLVGANYGSITDSYSTANVSGVIIVGGLVGWNRVTGAISNSYSTGAVSAGPGSSAIGGLVGLHEGFITNSYSTGSASGVDSVGGLVGFHFGATITNAYSAGSVSGSTFVGGLVGQRSGGTITSSYWDTQTSLQPASAGGTGLTTALMRQQSNFTGWDFATLPQWTITNGVTYPQLVQFLVPVTVPGPPPPPPPPPAPPSAPPPSAPAASTASSTASALPGMLDRLPDFVVQPLSQGENSASVTTGNPLGPATRYAFATGRRSNADPVLDVLQNCQP